MLARHEALQIEKRSRNSFRLVMDHGPWPCLKAPRHEKIDEIYIRKFDSLQILSFLIYIYIFYPFSSNVNHFTAYTAQITYIGSYMPIHIHYLCTYEYFYYAK